MIVISACLGGIACRYDGNDNLVSKIEDLLQQEETLLICPEVLGGLPTPRPSAEIIGGNGDDVLDGKAKSDDKRWGRCHGSFCKWCL